jgi:uncharacterized membrane protein
VWKDRVVIRRVLLPAAADHIAADLPVAVLIPQVLLPQALHQEAAPLQAVVVEVEVAEDISSLIQINRFKTDHSK